MTYQQVIDKYYPSDSIRRVIYMRHCEVVAQLAIDIARIKGLPLAEDEIREAAMLHDIGICLTDASGIDCHGTEPYIMHGVLGAELIRSEHLDEKYARVAERHTGAGITSEDIAEHSLPLPPGEYMPESLLERLICYADKFYSKSGDMKRKSLERVKESMRRIPGSTFDRFMTLHSEFAI